MRLLGDAVGLPKLLARGRVERNQTSARGTAFIFVAQPNLFTAGQGNDHAAIEVFERSHDLGAWMIVDVRLPQQLAGCRVDGVGISALITEERGVAHRLPGK